VLIAMLVFLLMRQVMPIAAALAGGVALSSFGTVSRFVAWGLRQGPGAAFGTGAFAYRAGQRFLAQFRKRPDAAQEAQEAGAIEDKVARPF